MPELEGGPFGSRRKRVSRDEGGMRARARTGGARGSIDVYGVGGRWIGDKTIFFRRDDKRYKAADPYGSLVEEAREICQSDWKPAGSGKGYAGGILGILSDLLEQRMGEGNVEVEENEG